MKHSNQFTHRYFRVFLFFVHWCNLSFPYLPLDLDLHEHLSHYIWGYNWHKKFQRDEQQSIQTINNNKKYSTYILGNVKRAGSCILVISHHYWLKWIGSEDCFGWLKKSLYIYDSSAWNLLRIIMYLQMKNTDHWWYTRY